VSSRRYQPCGSYVRLTSDVIGDDQVPKKGNLRYQLLAAQCGFAFEILFTIFWAGFGHNLPPSSPNLGAADLAAYFAAHRNAILFGNSMAALVGVLWIPWTAQLTVVMWRIEGSSPVLTIIQLIGGVLTAWVVMFCPAIWAAATFRSEIDPNLTRALNDVGFLLFNITYAVTSVQAMAAGLVGLADKSDNPVFPRWVCKWAIFTGISFIPLTAMPFFKTGPAVVERSDLLLGCVRNLFLLDRIDGCLHGQGREQKTAPSGCRGDA